MPQFDYRVRPAAASRPFAGSHAAALSPPASGVTMFDSGAPTHRVDDEERRRAIVWNSMRAGGHIVRGAVTTAVGAGVIPTVLGAPLGALGIFHGMVHNLIGLAIAIPTGIRGYVRVAHRALHPWQSELINYCQRGERLGQRILTASGLGGLVDLARQSVDWLIGAVARLTTYAGESSRFSQRTRDRLLAISGILQALRTSISHINDLRQASDELMQLDGIIDYVRTIVDTGRELWQQIRQPRPEARLPPSYQRIATLSDQPAHMPVTPHASRSAEPDNILT